MNDNILIKEFSALNLTDYLTVDFNKSIYDNFHKIDKYIINENFDFKHFFDELYKVLSVVYNNILIINDLIEYLEKYFFKLKEETFPKVYYKKKFINTLIFLIEKTFGFVIIDNKEVSKFINPFYSDSNLKNSSEISTVLYSIDFKIKTPKYISERYNNFMRDYVKTNHLKAYRNRNVDNSIFLVESLYSNGFYKTNITDLHLFIEKNFFKISYPKIENINLQNSVNLEKEVIIDYSNSKVNEKVIALNELGIIKFLQENNPICQTSTNKLAEVLSCLTGENATTLQSYLNPIINSSQTSQKNNPYSNLKTVEKTKNKLINIGLDISNKD